MATDPRQLFERQLALIAARDLDGLIAQYHADAALIRADAIARGHHELRLFFAVYLERQSRVRSVDAVSATEDTLYYQAAMSFASGDARVYGVFVLRDRLIWRQVAGIIPQG
ncbi:MAG: hypothetical protein ABR509_04675 [Candidatus Limnocylindria bacterium]